MVFGSLFFYLPTLYYKTFSKLNICRLERKNYKNPDRQFVMLFCYLKIFRQKVQDEHDGRLWRDVTEAGVITKKFNQIPAWKLTKRL